MRLTALLLLSLLTSACVAPVGGGGSSRGGDDDDDGECDLDTAKVVEKNLDLRSAGDIDDAKLPSGCWDLHGTLRIESPNVTTLAGLGKLAAVTNLELVNTKLTTLDLAEPLTVYEKLDVRNNQTLGSLDKLSIDQDRAVSITIQDNAALTSLGGLADLTRVEGKTEIPGDFVIRNNAKLVTIGLSQLTEVTGRLEISDNAALASLDGLTDLATIGGDFTVSGNAKLATAKLSRFTTVSGSTRIANNAALTTLDVANLEAVRRFEVSDNTALTSFTGVRARQINGDLVIRNNPKLATVGSMFSLDAIAGHLTIDNNAALTNLGMFTSTLRNLAGTLTVSNNPQLTDLGLISHMNGIGSVSVTNNTKLPFCKAQEINHCVPQHGGVSIVGNLNTTTNCDCWCD